MRLVILQTGNAVPEIAARRGDFNAWIRAGVGDAWRGDWLEHDVREGGVFPEIASASGFFITGSSSSVTERAPWMLRVEEYVRAIAARDVPLLGICFGHQIVARALGGEVARNPLGREIGTMRVTRVADDALFTGLARDFDVNGTHVDAVVRVPDGARLLATTPRDPAAAFAVGRAIRCVQFHPEFDADVMRGYLRARAHLVVSEGGDPDALFAAVREDTHGRAILQNFVRRFVDDETSATGAVSGGPP